MSLAEKNQNKNVLMLTLTSVVVSVLFSFMGAPFLRALSVTAKPKVFWSAGILLTVALLASGNTLASLYIGAIWMTLGLYNEFEKRGVNWKKAGFVSLCAGIASATIAYFVATRYFGEQDTLSNLLVPLQQTMNKAFPESPIEIATLKTYIPGLFSAMLFSALALGFILEAKVMQLFKIRQTKVASGLRWLEFRLPDVAIWVSLFAGLFSMISFGLIGLQKLSLNIVIISIAAFFFQGLAVIEFLSRAFRFGPVSKMVLYILVFLQLAPAVILLGVIDYWMDFRKRIRKKLKEASSN